MTPPLTEEQVRSLKVGDVVLSCPAGCRGRACVHHICWRHDPPVTCTASFSYHVAGDVVKRTIVAGEGGRPDHQHSTRSLTRRTSSSRLGFGRWWGRGTGRKTRAALKEYGAVYLHAVGGAAQFYARCLPRVHAVHLLEELGVPEAMWVFEARNFPAIVTMDSHGNSLHADVAAATGRNWKRWKALATCALHPGTSHTAHSCSPMVCRHSFPWF